MNIVFDATVLELPFTGIAKTSLLLYRECLTREADLAIAGLHRKPVVGTVPVGVRLVRCGRLFSGSYWRSSVFPRQAKRQGASAVHFPWNGGVPEHIAGSIVATTIHDVLPLEIPGSFKGQQDELRYRHDRQRDIDRSHVLFTDSEYSKQQIMSQFNLQYEPIVNYFGPTIENNPQAMLPVALDKIPYFIYLGGYDRRKGIVELLQVFLELHRQSKLNCRLLLAGKAHYFCDELKMLIAEGTQIGVVQELGYVPDPELSVLLRNSLALVYPSRFEGFGLPPLEAMHVGCPVVTTPFTSIPEVCGEAALYIDPGDKRSFGEALVTIQQNEALRANLREKGREQAAKFSWKKSADTFLAALSNCKLRGITP